MTGILVCDGCNDLFFVHGDRSSLPDYLTELPMFDGIREIKSRETSLGSIKKVTVSVFSDYCGKCAYDIKKRRRK